MPSFDSIRYIGSIAPRLPARNTNPLIGILEGEGVGPELIDVCRLLLNTIEGHAPVRFTLRHGGLIGKPAISACGLALSEDVTAFCSEIFARNGALLCGPGGDRFVYDLRRRFDLYCKLVPLRPVPALSDCGPLRPEAVAGCDILLVRENLGGLYQGDCSLEEQDGMLRARHCFAYDSGQVADIIDTAAKLARSRRGRLCVVTKPGGAPSISQLWESLARQAAEAHGVALQILEVDNASYQLVANSTAFDVVVAPNLFGDVLGDGSALLLASRGMSYSANFNHTGHGVYQTGHGAAHDLAGSDTANPLGQIQSLAMMLHESFGLTEIAQALLASIDAVLAAGWRTRDIAVPGCRVVGTRELGQRVAEQYTELLQDEMVVA